MKNYIYTFQGKIYPERVNFTLKGIPEIKFSHEDFGIEGMAKIEILNCSVKVEFATSKKINERSEPNINTLKNIIDDLTRTFVDIYCFINSYSYELDFEKVVCADLKLNHMFSVRGEYNITGKNEEFIEIYNIISSGKYPFLYYVLADFRRSIKYPGMTASFCYRAIETLRQSYFGVYNANKVTKDYKKEKIGLSWDNLNKNLGFSENDHKDLTKWAERNRHGEYPAITYKIREKFMNHTREIINRFIKLIIHNTGL